MVSSATENRLRTVTALGFDSLHFHTGPWPDRRQTGFMAQVPGKRWTLAGYGHSVVPWLEQMCCSHKAMNQAA
jgi:hypothetical protein